MGRSWLSWGTGLGKWGLEWIQSHFDAPMECLVPCTPYATSCSCFAYRGLPLRGEGCFSSGPYCLLCQKDSPEGE